MDSLRQKNLLLPFWAAGLSLLVAALLQFWRPCFFLTDDSFSLAFPVLVEAGQAVKEGGDPGVSRFIFGGGYSLAKDSMYTPNRHPFSVLVSLMAGTAGENFMVDLLCAANLALAAAGMACFLGLLRKKRLCAWGDLGILFLAMSYTWSGFSLLLGSSGYWYLFNVASLPWMFSALILRNRAGGILLLATAMFHAAAGGYPSCSIFSFALVAAGAVAFSAMDRKADALLRFGAGALLGFCFSLPWLWPALSALSESARGAAIDPAIASEKSMPVAVALGSFFLGSISMIFGNFELFGMKAHAYALASCAASWLLLATLVPKARNRVWTVFLGISFVALLLLISRPAWLGEIIYHLPLVRSMRWPYKEVFLLLFVLHLWAARGSLLEAKWNGMLAMVGCIFFLAPLIFFGPPSLSVPSVGRDLVLSGKAKQFWSEAEKILAPGTCIVPVMADEILYDIPVYLKTPGPLIGSHNFPALFGIRSWSGYSATLPDKLFRREPKAANVFGVYSISDKAKLMAIPNLTLIEMRSLDPLVIFAVDSNSGKESRLQPPP